MMTWYDDVIVRTIIDLPEDQLQELSEICRRDGISRAEAIRQAVAVHVQRQRRAGPSPAFGLWHARKLNALVYERRLRREWERPQPRAARQARKRR